MTGWRSGPDSNRLPSAVLRLCFRKHLPTVFPATAGDNPKCLGISSCRLFLVLGYRRQRDFAIVLVRKDLGHDLHQSIHIKHVRSSFAVPVQPGSPYPGATVCDFPGCIPGCTLPCRTFLFCALPPEPDRTGSCSLPPYGPAPCGRRRLLVCVFSLNFPQDMEIDQKANQSIVL